MKIIAFGDIHMAAGAARRIPGIREADLIIVTGDMTNRGGVEEAKSVLDPILSLNPSVLAQFGNMDRPEVDRYLESLDLNLHGQARLFHDEICLVGVGGSNPTPFRTPSEFSEGELLRLAEQAMQQGLECRKRAEQDGKTVPLILVSHVPPYGSGIDTLTNGRHVGSTAIRKIIERYRPDLCISGHIHEAKGKDLLAGTPLVNPGALPEGGYATIDINPPQLEIHLQ